MAVAPTNVLGKCSAVCTHLQPFISAGAAGQGVHQLICCPGADALCGHPPLPQACRCNRAEASPRCACCAKCRTACWDTACAQAPGPCRLERVCQESKHPPNALPTCPHARPPCSCAAPSTRTRAAQQAPPAGLCHQHHGAAVAKGALGRLKHRLHLDGHPPADATSPQPRLDLCKGQAGVRSLARPWSQGGGDGVGRVSAVHADAVT